MKVWFGRMMTGWVRDGTETLEKERKKDIKVNITFQLCLGNVVQLNASGKPLKVFTVFFPQYIHFTINKNQV
jgi:hypothetical protein